MIKACAKVKRCDVGLGGKHDLVRLGKVGRSHYTQQHSCYWPEPTRHGPIVAKGASHAPSPRFDDSQDSVETKGNRFAHPQGKVDWVWCHDGIIRILYELNCIACQVMDGFMDGLCLLLACFA